MPPAIVAQPRPPGKGRISCADMAASGFRHIPKEGDMSVWSMSHWHMTSGKTYHLFHTFRPRCHDNILVRMCQYLSAGKATKNCELFVKEMRKIGKAPVPSQGNGAKFAFFTLWAAFFGEDAAGAPPDSGTGSPAPDSRSGTSARSGSGSGWWPG